MHHSTFVQAYDLARYADARGSEAIIPELVYLLVGQSVPNATARRIPWGERLREAFNRVPGDQ